MDEGQLLLMVGALLATCIMIAHGASRVGVPSLVAFLAFGMLLGSDGLGGLAFADVHLARTAGTVALVLILFEGGLSTSWRRLRQVAATAALLSTIGVAVTALLTGVAAYHLFDLPWLQSFLLGAVVASTDAAAVFATLRYTNIRRRVARALEAETGGNDPMAIALTIGLIAWIEQTAYGFTDLTLLVVQQLGLGMLVGVLLGLVATRVFAHLPTSLGAFAPVASLAACMLSYGAAAVIGGSGFLAVYLVGLAVGSTPSRYRHHLVTFHEGIAFLSQVILFVTLGLLVYPHQLLTVAWASLGLAILLIFVIRPLAVWLAVPFGHFDSREKALLGFAGLRGAVPIVLGTFVLSAEIPHGETIFNIVFFVVLASALIQGATLERFAKWLGVVEELAVVPTGSAAKQPTIHIEFIVEGRHSIAGAMIKEVGLPRPAKITAIKRGAKRMRPQSRTVIQTGDHLLVTTTAALQPELEDVLERWRRRI